MAQEAAETFDPGTVYAIQGSLLNSIQAKLKALAPLENLDSQTLDIAKGDRKTVINVKGNIKLNEFREMRVQLCDDAGNTLFATILVK